MDAVERSQAAFKDLTSSTEYRVYLTGSWGLKYTVTAPGGEVIAVRGTRRQCRKAIREHRTTVENPQPKWWEAPVVETVPVARPTTFDPPPEDTVIIPAGIGHMGVVSSRDDLEALEHDLEARRRFWADELERFGIEP